MDESQLKLVLLDEISDEQLGPDANAIRRAAIADAERLYGQVDDHARANGGLAGTAEALAGGAAGLVIGTGQGAWDSVVGLVDAIAHPGETVEGLRASGERGLDYLRRNNAESIANDASIRLRMFDATVDLEQARLYLAGDNVGAAYFAGNQAGRIVGAVAGPGKLADLLLSARVSRAAATGTPRPPGWVARAAGELVTSLPSLLRNTALRAEVVSVLRSRNAYRWSEAVGVLHAAREGTRLGFTFRGTLKYGSNNGVDAVFFNAQTGRYAVWSAKGGMNARTVSDLGRTRYGRELSDAWLETTFANVRRLQPNTPNAALAATLRAEHRAGHLERYASFRASDRTYQVRSNGRDRVTGTVR